MDPALSTAKTPGEFLCQPERRIQIHFEGSQVPRIHADQIASGIERPLQFLFFVRLTQHVESLLSGLAASRTNSACSSAATINSNRIRLVRARLHDLPSSTMKSFRRQGRPCVIRGQAQVFE